MGITEVTVPKQYVIVQDTEPNGQFNGQIWFNEATAETFIFDNGIWKSLGIDLTILNEELALNLSPLQLRILVLETLQQLDFKDFDTGQADIFNVAEGLGNTINSDTNADFFNSSNLILLYNNFPNTDGWTSLGNATLSSSSNRLRLAQGGGNSNRSVATSDLYTPAEYPIVKVRVRYSGSGSGSGTFTDGRRGFGLVIDNNNWIAISSKHPSVDERWHIEQCVGGSYSKISTTNFVNTVFDTFETFQISFNKSKRTISVKDASNNIDEVTIPAEFNINNLKWGQIFTNSNWSGTNICENEFLKAIPKFPIYKNGFPLNSSKFVKININENNISKFFISLLEEKNNNNIKIKINDLEDEFNINEMIDFAGNLETITIISNEEFNLRGYTIFIWK